jgi:hypothetical protein
MKLLNILNKQPNLTEHTKMYIARYKIIYKRVIREAKRRENDHYIMRAKYKSKAIWQVIHKETGRTFSQKQDIKIVRNSEEITNPYQLSELFNSYFCKISQELLKKNGGKKTLISENYHLKIKKNSKTMFLSPITESEVVKVARCFKNKLTAGINEIPDHVVKQCIELLKVPLTNIYDTSFESGIFPDELKIAKVIPVHKKKDRRDVHN